MIRFCHLEVNLCNTRLHKYALGGVKEVKCKVVPVRAIKACRGSRGIAPLILKLGTRWRSVVKFTPWPLCSWEGSRKEVVGYMNPRACLDEEKNPLSLPAFEARIVQPVA